MCDGCIEEYLEGEGRTGFTPEELAPYTLVVLAIAGYYQLPRCDCGGPLHVVLDDVNVDDDTIQSNLDDLDEWLAATWHNEPLSPGMDAVVRVTTQDLAAQLLAIPSLAIRAKIASLGVDLGYDMQYRRTRDFVNTRIGQARH